MALTYFITTFGCQMNKGDSELMAHSMKAHGFEEADSEANADIVIFNTCSVRQHAEERALARIGAAVSRKKKHGAVAVAGCMAQRLGNTLIEKYGADIVIGPYRSPAAGAILAGYLFGGGTALHLSQETGDLESRIHDSLAREKDALPWHKWITITHGCENFCAYCIVPHVRGGLVSFPSESILRYARICVHEGIKEITLLGQNVNQYGMDSGDIPFSRLLGRIAEIDGLLRVNFLTSHPKDFTADIIEVVRDHDIISRALHLPLQSGSDPVLARMNRQYTFSQYMALVERIEHTLSSYSISTDLIVGFPGETADDFERTLSAVRAIRFDEAYMYAYSPREGTAAYDMEETLSREEKLDRLQCLIDTQREISLQKLHARLHHTESVIIESMSKKSDTEMMGKTFLNHPIVTPGTNDDIGKKFSITVTAVKGSTLYGEKIA